MHQRGNPQRAISQKCDIPQHGVFLKDVRKLDNWKAKEEVAGPKNYPQ